VTSEECSWGAPHRCAQLPAETEAAQNPSQQQAATVDLQQRKRKHNVSEKQQTQSSSSRPRGRTSRPQFHQGPHAATDAKKRRPCQKRYRYLFEGTSHDRRPSCVTPNRRADQPKAPRAHPRRVPWVHRPEELVTTWMHQSAPILGSRGFRGMGWDGTRIMCQTYTLDCLDARRQVPSP
jgi:hypothetical protein